jgi:hypothetical protein
MVHTIKKTPVKILAILGTVLAWFPLLATVLTGAIVTIRAGSLHLDYLMPAELFPVAFAGGALLFVAALLARARRALIGWGLLAAIALLIGGQGLAVVTGLASGETEPVGWPWALVLASLVSYVLALLIVAIGGVLLLRGLFRRDKVGEVAQSAGSSG